jgi:hypothetical protein
LLRSRANATIPLVRRGVIGFLAVALAGLALVSVWSSFRSPVRWSPDGLYYQARLLEFRGVSEPTAMQRTFEGPISAPLRARDQRHTGNPAWVKYNEPFYERRVIVPLAGAAIYPLAGDRSLLYLSLAGYIASILALFGLLLLRFRTAIATAVTLVTIFLPALTTHSSYPLTDSWGLTLEIGAFAAALLTLDRGLRWLPLWIGSIALLSLTRDSTWIPLLAVGWCAVRYRTRVPVTLFASGLAAVVPALLLFKMPVQDLLALLVNHSDVSADTSWSFIASHYPRALVDLVRSDVGFLRRGQWYTALYFVVGILALLIPLRRRRATMTGQLMIAGAALALGYVVAAPVFSAFRLELVFIPMAAYGLALAAEAVTARVTVNKRLERVPLPAWLVRS